MVLILPIIKKKKKNKNKSASNFIFITDWSYYDDTPTSQ
jgi:hypothetical protein